MLWRILHRLELRPGVAIPLGWLSELKSVGAGNLAILEQHGSISKVHAPPLEVISELLPYRRRLKKLGVQDLVELLVVDLTGVFKSDEISVLHRIALDKLEVKDGCNVYR